MWTEKDSALHAKLIFANFKKAFAFMTEVAFYAEEHAHHPNWSNVYNTVTITLQTHDAGNVVTEKDRALAEVIEQIYSAYTSA